MTAEQGATPAGTPAVPLTDLPAGSRSLTRRGFLTRGGAIAAGLMAAPLVGSLAACSSSASDGPMSFWNFYGPGGPVPGQAKWFSDTVAQWNRRQKRVRDKINLRYITNPDYINGSVLSTGFASDNGPDIFLLSPGDFLRYYNGGALQDISPHLENGVRDDYVTGALGTRVVDDKVYGLPMEIEPLAIYYNKQAWEKAGLDDRDIPQDWDKLVEVADKLRTNDRFGITFEVTPGYYQNFTWYPFMWQGDGTPVNTQSDGSDFDSKAVRAALQYWQTFIERGLAPRTLLGTGGGDINSNLGSGYTAMQQSGVWSVAELEAGPHKDLPVGVFRLPTPPGGKYTTALGGWAFVANAKGPNPEKAAEFCAWALASTDDEGIERCRQWNTVVKTNLPPRTSVQKAARAHGAFKGNFAYFADVVAKGGRGEPRYPAQVYQAVSDAVQACQLGGAAAGSAASRASDIIDSYLQGYRGATIA